MMGFDRYVPDEKFASPVPRELWLQTLLPEIVVTFTSVRITVQRDRYFLQATTIYDTVLQRRLLPEDRHDP